MNPKNAAVSSDTGQHLTTLVVLSCTPQPVNSSTSSGCKMFPCTTTTCSQFAKARTGGPGLKEYPQDGRNGRVRNGSGFQKDEECLIILRLGCLGEDTGLGGLANNPAQ